MLLKGSCLCGNVKFECVGEPNWVEHCRCESCRKNCAAPFTSFFGMNNNKFEFTLGIPEEHKSTDGVVRSLCSSCGTPLSYFNQKWPYETHFYLAALKDASQVKPQFHVHWNERVDWINVDDSLPKNPASADDGNPI